MAEHEEPSSGVRELIERVRSEAVEAGEQEAKRLLDEARREAARIVEAAREEAAAHRDEAEQYARKEQEAGRAALVRAARDTVLQVQEELTGRFADQLRRLVEERLADPAFLERLVLELVGAERPADDEPAELLLPRRPVDIDELRRRHPELGGAPLDAFVVSVAQLSLREGVTVRAVEAEDTQAGLRLRLRDGEVEVEVSPESLTELLEHHLLPRFRGLLEGVFR